MSSSPSPFSDFGQTTPTPESPRRTSAFAVASLVVSIVALPCCFLPPGGVTISLVGLALGITAITTIASSQGRLKGTGFAASGAVISLLGLAASSLVWISARTMVNSLGTYGKFITTAQSDDPSALEAMLTPAAASEATSEGIAKFRTTLNAECGAYSGKSPGMIEFFMNFGSLAPIQNSLPPKFSPSAGSPLLPVPCEFAKGEATVLFFTDPANQTPALPLGRLRNVAVILPDGSLLWFIDPAGATTPTTPTPAPPATPEKTAPPAKPPTTGG